MHVHSKDNATVILFIGFGCIPVYFWQWT